MALGLRGQLVIALFVVFAVSFSLLSAAVLQLTGRNVRLDQKRIAQISSQLLASADDGQSEASLRATLQKLQAQGVIDGAVVVTDGAAITIGRPGPKSQGATAVRRNGQLTLWPKQIGKHQTGPMQRLLLFYVGLTGLSVMLLAYVWLTFTIVRPLEAATRSAEILAAGDLNTKVPLRGAVEVVRLARAYNRMADELRKERAELQDHVRDLERASEALKASQQQVVHGEKLASVGRLSAGVAHEIGNPLAAMLGLLELLQEEDLPVAQQREFITRIQKETERIHHIIGGLLTYARKDTVENLQQQRADLRDAVEDAIALLQQQGRARKVTLDAQIDEDARAVVGGGAQLTQLTLNLLLNALDAVADGGTIRVQAVHSAAEVTLTVEDNGSGLRDDILDRLFEPFATTKPPGQGTGLGLAVCHALVEQMGGHISADNRVEGGARFTVVLQRAT